MININKNTLINKVAENTEKAKREVTEILDAIFDTIVDEVASGNDVTIFNFGKFSSKRRIGCEKTYTFDSKNDTFKKGDKYFTEDKIIPTFSFSKTFTDSVAE